MRACFDAVTVNAREDPAPRRLRHRARQCAPTSCCCRRAIRSRRSAFARARLSRRGGRVIADNAYDACDTRPARTAVERRRDAAAKLGRWNRSTTSWLGLPSQVQALLRGPLPPVRARRARGGGGGGRAQLPAHRRPSSRAHDLPRPRRSAPGRHASREDRTHHSFWRRVAARRGARARDLPGDRAAAREVRGAGRRQDRRADHRRHPHRRDRRRPAGRAASG